MESKTKTILIVEDDAGVLELLSEKIEACGFKIIGIQNALGAIQWLKKNTPFLMVLDYQLPDMNCKELIQQLNKDEITIPPFIVSTGQGDEHVAVEMMKLGALDYIIKDNQFLEVIPIVINRLNDEIEKDQRLKKSEQELSELSQFNHQIIDSALEGIIVYDRELNYVTWNPFMERLIGSLEKDVIGKNAYDVFPFLKEVGVIANVENALKGIIGPEVEFVLNFNSTGKQGWVSDAVSTLKNAKGEIVGAISIVRDITEKKRAEEALQKNLDSLKELLFDNSELILNESNSIDFNKLTEIIRKISGAKYASFNIFVKNTLDYKVVGFAGLKDFNSLSKKYLGYDFSEKKWEFDSERAAMVKDRTITTFDNLYDYIGNLMPRPVYYLIIKTFHLGEVSIVRISKNDSQKGDFTLLFKKGETLQNPEIVELFANQVGLFLERKNAEDEIKSSNSLLNATLESTADGILVVDKDGHPTLYNKRFCELWKVPQNILDEKVDGQLLKYVLTQMDHPKEFQTNVRYLMENNELANIEEIELIDGRVFERYSIPQRFGNKIVGRVWSFRDITENKLATEALQESEKRYRKFINSTPDMVYIKDEELKYLVVNSTLCEYYRKTENEIIGKTDYDFIDKPFADKCRLTDKESLLSNDLVVDEESHGDLMFESVKFPVEYEKGKIGVGGFIKNITDRKTAELALKEKMEEMMRFHKMVVGRELVMVELKKEINDLLKKAGEEEKYRIAE